MLLPPDKQTLTDLKSLENNGAHQRVLEWFKESLGYIRDINDTELDGVVLRQNQGAAQVLKEFLDYMNEKDIHLARFER